MTDHHAGVIIRRSSLRLLLGQLQVLMTFVLGYRLPPSDALRHADTASMG